LIFFFQKTHGRHWRRSKIIDYRRFERNNPAIFSTFCILDSFYL